MRRPRSRVAILSVIIVGVLIFAGCLYAYNTISDVFAPVGGDKDVSITVRQGSTTAEIADELESKGIIRNALAFRLWARIRGLDTKLEAGVYDNINSKMPISQIIDKLQEATPDEILVQIKEGQRLEQIADFISTNATLPKFKKADFLKYTKNINEFPDKGKYPTLFEKVPQGASMEGLLYPETFAVPKDGNALAVINTSLKFMEDALVKNKLKEKAAQNKMTVYEFLTLASIVEREAAGAQDRDKIASVYWNRINTDRGIEETGGGKMEADPTVQYAADTEDKVTKYWTPLKDEGKNIAIENKYNTYTHTGFPPGPICTSSLKSIIASAAPAKTDYLYFYADKKNVSHFSKTLDEHNQKMAENPPIGS